MEIDCPACKKVNLDSGECERCGCDLTTLVNILEAALFELTEGIGKLKKGEGARALFHAKKSWRLKKNHSAAKLAFMACIDLKCLGEASTWYHRAKDHLNG